MDTPTFAQLVENIKADGVLTSAPTVYKGEVLSGNHRVLAAIDAGIEEADVLEIVSPLTDDQKVAIQLSHNAIVGQDDPNILYELYSGLDFGYKSYSGLDDDLFGDLRELDVASLAVAVPDHQELVFLFLPEQEEVFVEHLEAIDKSKKTNRTMLAHYDDFGRIFDAIVAVKEKHNIHNAAAALRVMADLAIERLDQEDSDQQDAQV